MTLKDTLNKPYYFLRPQQIFSRLSRAFRGPRSEGEFEKVTLPWGLPIRVRPQDAIGATIIRAGLYDLCVSEVLWRLLDAGETAIDAGANIGQMTSVMATRVGEGGRTLSFEPHPQIFQELTANVALWKSFPKMGRIETYEMGLSSEAGEAHLHTSREFARNRGTASLEAKICQGGTAGTVSVKIGRLDDVVSGDVRVGVMKLDVEGHEMSLLQGAARLLAERRIRDILFEAQDPYPSPLSGLLEQAGYQIVGVEQGPLGPQVYPANRNGGHYQYEALNCLATLDAPRALGRLGGKGYQTLRRQR